MGDAENLQPSKKRAAGVQLSRENPGLDDDGPEQEAGTFKKASDDVLARRRIVKVRRPQASTPAAPPSTASNPFAAIRLVPPTAMSPAAPAQVEAHSGQSKDTDQIDESKSDNRVDEQSKEESTKDGKTDVNDDNSKQPEDKVDDSKAQPDDKNANVVDQEKDNSVAEEVVEGGNSGDGATKSTEADTVEAQTGKDVKGDGDEKGNSVAEEVVEGANSGDGATKSTEADTIEAQAGNNVKGDGDEKEKENEAAAEKNEEAAPFSSFRQLSSTQNAFSGLTGTGFSGTSFSFGSITTDGTAPKIDSTTFSFGVSNNGSSSIFGSAGASTITKSEGTKFPPKQEVPLETGEENENAVFTADSILFEYMDGAWKERGKGELKVNVSTTGTGKARLVMRARGNYRLILNASLFPDMKLANMDKKGITFACVNSAGEGKDTLATFALKFKDPSIVEDFRAEVTKHKSTAPVALRTPENSPKADE
ncbi:nuclear pore complex protein NUP50A-like [Salvia hispanica]|uniref:nuclear pore complex protein NUP50A-like n=1 Tax=Salvia hispanica TaxID=49212 RepID=UPI002009467A|nr:nuclear pore complex protein NUP50A-like [Salvia hispanica]XP_047960950.1 nuclear pore complex protein NUP50A-like [Salvia hispanica]